jgi:membrane protease YdiL (CAAX protease family)
LIRTQISHPLVNATLVLAGILVFACFIHDSLPAKLLAFGGLLVCALTIVTGSGQDAFLKILGLGELSLKGLLFTGAGMLLGTAFALFTRLHFHLSPFPGSLSLVAVVASLTGATEELVFRGYIQGRLNRVHPFFALGYAAIAHTAYKLLVIYSLGRPGEFDFLFLTRWTLLGGLVFGFLRYFSKRIYPPLAAHVLFDVLVYGGSVVLPFWVWS